MKNKIWIMLIVFGIVTTCFNVGVHTEEVSGPWGSLKIYPDVSMGIITQEQFIEFQSNLEDVEVDVCLVFDVPVSNPDIWIWRNISHDVSVLDYGWVQGSFELYDISDYELLEDTPEFVDYGDIPSDNYASGDATCWDGTWWNTGHFIVGYDSFEWIEQGVSAEFTYEYWGIVGSHVEQQWWMDWDNSIHDSFHQTTYQGSQVFYVRHWTVKDKLYLFKINYDTELNSGLVKWDLYAKKSSDPLGSWRLIIDPYWDSDWSYFKTFEVADKIEGYQMRIVIEYSDGLDASANVSLNSHSQIDLDDIRFVYNNVTVLPHWIENVTESISGVFWVNNTGNYSEFECFYGNSVVDTVSNGTDTFIEFDDFEDAVQGDWTTANGAPEYDSSDRGFGGSSQSWKGYNVATNDISTIPVTITEDIAVRWHLWRASGAGAVHHPTRITDWISYVQIGRGGTNNIETHNGAAHQDTGFDAPSSTWFSLEVSDIDFTGNTFDLFMDRSIIADDAALWNVDQGNNEYMIQSVTTFTNYMDSYLVRKWNTNNPYWSAFGTEQEFPWSPYLKGEAPSNESVGYGLTPAMYIVCTDNNTGDTMNVSWLSNSSGEWMPFGKNLSVVSGTNITIQGVNFSDYITTYWWSVNCTDGNGLWVNSTFWFITRSANNVSVIGTSYPVNGSANLCIPIMIGIAVSDIDTGNLMNITFYSNLSGSWDYFYTGELYTVTNVTNGTYYIDPVFFVKADFVYYWNCSVFDGLDTVESGIFSLSISNVACGGGGIGIGNIVGVSGVIGIFGLIGWFMNRRRNK